MIHRNALFGGALLATLLLASAPLSAQTRDYNPIRRTSATEELPAAARPATSTPANGTTQTWTPPVVSGPPGQWRSVRQPGPVQLPAPRYMPSRTIVQQQPSTPAEASGPELEEVPAEAESATWPDGAPGPHGPACPGPGCSDGCCHEDRGSCGGSCCESSGRGFGLCGGACGGNCGSCLWKCGCLLPQCWELFAGVQGFKGPPDRGENGNFGFHEGFNLGGTFGTACGLGYQFGGRYLQSNLSGETTVFTRTAQRDQAFYTAGLFRRAPCGYGLQGGVVWDFLDDEYYVDMELTQIRGELSFLTPWGREFGFWFAASADDDSAPLFATDEIWEPTDQYAFFYRKQFGCGGQGRLWGGWAGEGDGIFGGDVSMPLSNCWGVRANFNYLIPDENGVASIPEEAWGIGISLVWYPGGTATGCAPCRPLFDVADNATFMVDRFSRVTTDID